MLCLRLQNLPAMLCVCWQQTVEAMGREAATTLQGPVQTACRDILVPSFESACQSMMQQLSGTFQRGTHDCT